MGVNRYIKEFWQVNNQEMISGAKNFYEFIDMNKKHWRNSSFLPSNLSVFPKIEEKVLYKKLDTIELGTKYVYPIPILGSGQLNTPTANNKGVYLPDRIIKDAREGLCKILIHEVFEGHGYNLSYFRTFFETLASFYQIPISSLGFLDSNYYTPDLQKEYNTKGFFYPFWEFHVASHGMFTESNSSFVHHRLDKQKKGELECPYYFINLNRRSRFHRSILTYYNFKKWSDKIQWSYTEPNSQNMTKLWSYLPEESLLSMQDYFKVLPKIIDVASDVNDTHVSDIQFNGYINLVTETMFFEQDTLFFSEKIYKPIQAGQPFLLVGNAGSLELLRKQGYETFSPFINEEYDTILEPCRRMECILKEIDRICSMSPDRIKMLLQNVEPVCRRNYIKMMSRVNDSTIAIEAINQINRWLHE